MFGAIGGLGQFCERNMNRPGLGEIDRRTGCAGRESLAELGQQQVRVAQFVEHPDSEFDPAAVAFQSVTDHGNRKPVLVPRPAPELVRQSAGVPEIAEGQPSIGQHTCGLLAHCRLRDTPAELGQGIERPHRPQPVEPHRQQRTLGCQPVRHAGRGREQAQLKVLQH